MATGFCIECDTTLNLGKSPYKGQKVTCFKCGAVLDVINISPIELDWALDEDFIESDFDTDFDFEEHNKKY